MSLRTDEVSQVLSAAQRALESGRLNSWEQRFIRDMKSKVERYGAKARLSPKQGAKLRQVLRPYLGAGNVTRFPSARGDREPRTSSKWSRPSRRTSYRRRRTLLLTPWRYYWFRRYVIGLLFAAGIVGVFSLGHQRQSPTAPNVQPSASTYATRKLTLGDFTVTDGDTIRLNGALKGIRLVGFNTPETFDPVCGAGLALGTNATERLNELLTAAEAIELEMVPCACQPGTEGTDRCNYGRTCGVLRVDGAHVGQTLIAEGLAAPFVCGRTSCPPTPRPWCE